MSWALSVRIICVVCVFEKLSIYFVSRQPVRLENLRQRSVYVYLYYFFPKDKKEKKHLFLFLYRVNFCNAKTLPMSKASSLKRGFPAKGEY